MAILDRLPDPGLPWAICWDGVKLLASREKCATAAYLDWPGRVPTIGFGETEGILIGMTWTIQQCDERLLAEVGRYAREVRAMCTVSPGANQLAALVVCAYNIGLGGMRRSSMMRLHNRGQFNEAARAFGLWNKARDATTGKLIEVDELTSRRAAEAALYLMPESSGPAYPMPQGVAAEPTLRSSPTVQAGTAAIGAGAFTLTSILADAGPVITTAREWADKLNVQPLYVLGGCLVAFGALTLWRRYQQRQRGAA